jgi:hypothetical protein
MSRCAPQRICPARSSRTSHYTRGAQSLEAVTFSSVPCNTVNRPAHGDRQGATGWSLLDDRRLARAQPAESCVTHTQRPAPPARWAASAASLLSRRPDAEGFDELVAAAFELRAYPPPRANAPVGWPTRGRSAVRSTRFFPAQQRREAGPVLGFGHRRRGDQHSDSRDVKTVGAAAVSFGGRRAPAYAASGQDAFFKATAMEEG